MGKAATAAEKRYMDAASRMGCCICRRLGYDVDGMQALIHHQIHGRGGWGRASNWRTIPLCGHHHVDSKEGVHALNAELFFDYYGFSEQELIIETQQANLRLVPTTERVTHEDG